MGRVTLRNPRHPNWPRDGERTELADVADRWKWAYVDRAHELHRERVVGGRPKLLRAAVREYLEHRRDAVATATWRNDRTALGHLADDYANTAVHQIDPQKTLNRLLREGYQPYTVETYSAFLSGFWRWCGLTYDVSLPRRQRNEPRVWSDEEVVRLRKAAGASEGPLLLALDVGLYMGLRWGEIMGLDWSDVDLTSWTVRVQRQKGGAPLKGRRARTALILPGWTHGRGIGPVVGALRRQRITGLLEAAGLSEVGVGWHAARHSYARMFLEAKPDMRLLQASLGHASVTQTEDAYDHLLPDQAAAMARRAIHGI
jgi:integrase